MKVGLLGLLGRPSALISLLAPFQLVVFAVISAHLPSRTKGAGVVCLLSFAYGLCMGALESVPGILL